MLMIAALERSVTSMNVTCTRQERIVEVLRRLLFVISPLLRRCGARRHFLTIPLVTPNAGRRGENWGDR